MSCSSASVGFCPNDRITLKEKKTIIYEVFF
jgi:hypothetical protein